MLAWASHLVVSSLGSPAAVSSAVSDCTAVSPTERSQNQLKGPELQVREDYLSFVHQRRFDLSCVTYKDGVHNAARNTACSQEGLSAKFQLTGYFEPPPPCPHCTFCICFVLCCHHRAAVSTSQTTELKANTINSSPANGIPTQEHTRENCNLLVSNEIPRRAWPNLGRCSLPWQPTVTMRHCHSFTWLLSV